MTAWKRYRYHRREVIQYTADAAAAMTVDQPEPAALSLEGAHTHEVECGRIIICAVAPWAVAIGVFVALWGGLR